MVQVSVSVVLGHLQQILVTVWPHNLELDPLKLNQHFVL